eukprot:CAMPEP_0179033956 /NCGR_PEP_ID=MMETSP0796-20121207/12363_1 /TAXON_ID=73915 /ORGANISM="Pyrodinium bahamense, Strain pbaha01" /LENGTH=46 /DNA_ID= /DNA_START= /DNA_END= /DNA_ORIENTATION=
MRPATQQRRTTKTVDAGRGSFRGQPRPTLALSASQQPQHKWPQCSE